MGGDAGCRRRRAGSGGGRERQPRGARAAWGREGREREREVPPEGRRCRSPISDSGEFSNLVEKWVSASLGMKWNAFNSNRRIWWVPDRPPSYGIDHLSEASDSNLFRSLSHRGVLLCTNRRLVQKVTSGCSLFSLERKKSRVSNTSNGNGGTPHAATTAWEYNSRHHAASTFNSVITIESSPTHTVWSHPPPCVPVRMQINRSFSIDFEDGTLSSPMHCARLLIHHCFDYLHLRNRHHDGNQL